MRADDSQRDLLLWLAAMLLGQWDETLAERHRVGDPPARVEERRTS